MPLRSADLNRKSTRPQPPPTASTAMPPKKCWMPFTRYDWRLNIGIQRTPFSRIHTTVSRERFTSRSASSGSDRFSVTFIRSSM